MNFRRKKKERKVSNTNLQVHITETSLNSAGTLKCKCADAAGSIIFTSVRQQWSSALEAPYWTTAPATATSRLLKAEAAKIPAAALQVQLAVTPWQPGPASEISIIASGIQSAAHKQISSTAMGQNKLGLGLYWPQFRLSWKTNKRSPLRRKPLQRTAVMSKRLNKKGKSFCLCE